MQTKPVFLLLVFSCFLGSAELHAQLSNPVGKWRILTHVMFLPDALDKGEAWVDSNLLPVGFEASIQIDSNGRFVWQTPESMRTGKWQLKRRNQRFIMRFDDGDRVMLGGRGPVNFYQPLILPEKFETLYKTLGIRPSFGEST